jgi:CheY-like chemotaxis protein
MHCPASPTAALRVLLVEDDDSFAEWVDERLPCAQFTRVVSLAEAEVALALDRYDVVLLDLTLPDGAGLATVDRVLAAPQVPTAIVLTNVIDDNLRDLALERGVQAFCDKTRVSLQPDPGAYLCQIIREATARQRGENNRLLGFARLFDRAAAREG